MMSATLRPEELARAEEWLRAWLAAAPGPGGPRPKGTEDSDTTFGHLCKPSQPSPASPASLFCATGPQPWVFDTFQQIRCRPLDRACFPAPGGPRRPPEASPDPAEGSSGTGTAAPGPKTAAESASISVKWISPPASGTVC